jgi:hypothetical protein
MIKSIRQFFSGCLTPILFSAVFVIVFNIGDIAKNPMVFFKRFIELWVIIITVLWKFVSFYSVWIVTHLDDIQNWLRSAFL